jgi:hypothetical protein
MKKKILLFSYWVNVEGNSPALVADDKIESLTSLGYEIHILTSFASKQPISNEIKQFRIPSISFHDYLHEFKEIKKFEDFFKFILFLPFVLTIGLFFDIIQYLFIKGMGGGKWSWFILSAPFSIFYSFYNKVDYLFTMGGPAATHLTGAVCSFFTKKKLFIELQDPLAGLGIGRNKFSSKYLLILEKILLIICHKLIYVTKSASNEAKSRYEYNLSKKIFGIYTGSKNFYFSKNSTIKKNKISFIHAGTLYSTRNFYSLIKAIEFLIQNRKILKSEIEILNIGEIYGEIKKHHLNKSYISWQPIQSREKALKKCCEADFLLLIQHTDYRSKLTLPYKLYDYLNLKKPIFALTNNSELNSILKINNHFNCDVNNYKDIASKLMNLINYKYSQKTPNFYFNKIKHIDQCQKIFE